MRKNLRKKERPPAKQRTGIKALGTQQVLEALAMEVRAMKEWVLMELTGQRSAMMTMGAEEIEKERGIEMIDQQEALVESMTHQLENQT